MERFKQKFADGDSFAFCTGVVDGVADIPQLVVTRFIEGVPKTASISLMDTDTGEDVCQGLFEALGDYLAEKEEALALATAETTKSKGKK